MILDDLKVIDPPDNKWVERLRPGHFIWAVKEQRFAKVEWAYEPPEPGTISGRIGIRFCWRDGDRWGTEGCNSWYVKSNAYGFDGKPLLQPVKDNCPSEMAPIPEPWQRKVERQLADLSNRIKQLESGYLRYTLGPVASTTFISKEMIEKIKDFGKSDWGKDANNS